MSVSLPLRWLIADTVLCGAGLAYTGINALEPGTWLMETAPVFIVFAVMWATYRRFPLSSLLYFLILLHSVVLMIGGMYTYAKVPFGFEMAHWLGIERNPYDKVGHFMQGFVPAIAAREILIRGKYVNGKKMLIYIILSIVLGFSAFYELIEWGAALALGQGADAFLGTQGDIWDTQSDMFFALIGGIAALITLSFPHQKQINALEHHENPR
ncbi:MAG: DUF2238 domain-containing protein [Sulfuricurvum sp.]